VHDLETKTLLIRLYRAYQCLEAELEYYVLWLSNLLLLGDGAPERRLLSISSSSFLNFPKQNFFQFILVLEDVPPVEDEPAGLQRENKQNIV
jgi:hypothetical protein